MVTGCIKENSDVSWRTFNLLLGKVSLDYQIGHLYVVDIEFDHTKATENQIVYNEIYPPIIEKQKIIDPCERSVYQLIEQYAPIAKGNPRTYRATKKSHATFIKKKFHSMYLVHLRFAIKGAGWHVTKIYSPFTFEQECFKNSFILMNQKSRQEAKNSIEKDFYKLMNNSNFGYGCRNIIGNCQFVPIFDELKEITYLKQYYTYFDSKVSSFVNADLIKQEVKEKYNDLKMKLSKNDKLYEIKLSTLNAEKSEALEGADNFDKKCKRQKKKRTLYHYFEREEEGYRNNKIKNLIDFDEEYLSSIKSLAAKKQTKINLTTRFLNGKMLMFSKTSFQSFVYDLIDVFMFPEEDVKKFYENNKIEKCFLFQNLTDIDSTSVFFILVCKI